MTRYVALIPARGGSKGVPGKNIREIQGKPLICWSIEQALCCSKISQVLVSTDCANIAALAKATGAEIPSLRPSVLAQDDTSTEAVMLHVAEHWLNWEENIVLILLQPTSPLRHKSSLDSAIAHFEQDKADSLVSVCESHAFFWKCPQHPQALYNYMQRPRRQDIPQDQRNYRENGSIYLTKLPLLKQYGNRLGGRIAMYCMTEEESWEIDSLTDFAIVSQLMKENGI